MDAFYRPLAENRFASTEHTVGPWSPDSQHMGPPAALLTRALERINPDMPVVLARVTVEILGPVPVGELRTRAWGVRPGRSVGLAAAELIAGDRAVATASAWWIAAGDTAEVAAGLPDPLPGTASAQPLTVPDGWPGGYLHAMEWRTVKGGIGVPGPATIWARQRVALVAGEEPSPMQRLLAVADSGNGVSSRLDPREWLFINTELTVHTWRAPAGEWIGLDATTTIGPTGIGTAASVLHDERGAVGRGTQALLVRQR
jgi:hypothetical protein